MNKKHTYQPWLWAALMGGLWGVWAQGEPQEPPKPPDPFEENLYASFREKAMENYDKALNYLDLCAAARPDDPIVDFERGKNYYFKKEYNKAYEAFEKAAQKKPDYRWAWAGMYDVCYDTREFAKAIPIVEKLVTFKDSYEEDLVSLYMMTRQFEKALPLIHQIEEKYGRSEKRDAYKADILRDPKFQGPEQAALLQRIKSQPQEEAPYIELIFLYNKSGQEDKAIDVARQLEKNIPTSDWAQVSLFKAYLQQGQADTAYKALQTVVKSSKIDWKIKQRAFNEWLVYVQMHPEREAELRALVPLMAEDKSVAVWKELGKFFYSKSQWDKSIFYLTQQWKNQADDKEALTLLLQALTQAGRFPELAKLADEAMAWYPAMPELYYHRGLALNQMKQFAAARDVLEMGTDYLVDTSDVAINTYVQLGEAYAGLGQSDKKEKAFQKAQKLIDQRKAEQNK